MGELDLSLGVLLISIFVDTYLYGIVTSQYMQYHSTEFGDRAWLRATIGFLFILDTFQSASTIWMVYNFCVTHFNDMEYAVIPSLKSTWPYTWSILANSINAGLTQGVLAYRFFRLTKNVHIFRAFSVFAFATCCVGLFTQIRAYTLIAEDGYARFATLRAPFIIARSMEALLDFALTSSLIYTLHRARTGYRRTEKIINSLISGAVKTGFFCMAFSIASIPTFIDNALQPTYVYGLVAMNQGKISTATLLYSLLKRKEFMEPDDSWHLSTGVLFNSTVNAHDVRSTGFEFRVRRDLSTEVMRDNREEYEKGRSTNDIVERYRQRKDGDGESSTTRGTSEVIV